MSRGPLERIEREELERGGRAPDEPAAEPRPAATIVPASPCGEGFRILLLRRPETSRFAAGAYAFPGGVIDPGDRDPELAVRLPRTASGEGEEAALAAALRELFEETGILPADVPPEAGPRVEGARRDLLAGRRSFGGVARELDLRFRRLEVVYFSRWITPEKLRRRYDARFFLAALAEPEPEPRLTREHTAHAWLSPPEAVRRFQAGELPMLFPTWKTVERLSRLGSLEEALRRLAREAVRVHRPRLLVRQGRVRPVLPGEPGYGEAGP